MPSTPVTKWLLACLALLVIGQFAWILTATPRKPSLSEIINTTPIGEHSLIYEAASDSGGATVGRTYFYYVFERQDSLEKALATLQGQPAFLVTRQSGAIVSVKGQQITAHAKDTVYQYSSLAVLREKGQTLPVNIELTATQPEQ
ncbi:hypothetical protein GCM10009504_16010 [Pseudomonas laurentiana]|nr:hypothetical protein [Pseudomonas laurentiana]GGU59875.1 hypothetical protein GCM10009504_16010 [Pseudomonas laurentiana]